MVRHEYFNVTCISVSNGYQLSLYNLYTVPSPIPIVINVIINDPELSPPSTVELEGPLETDMEVTGEPKERTCNSEEALEKSETVDQEELNKELHPLRVDIEGDPREGVERGVEDEKLDEKEDESVDGKEKGEILGEKEGESMGNEMEEGESAGEKNEESGRMSDKEKDGDNVGEDEHQAHMMRILKGDFTHLPPAKTNIIRIFLSSTFSGNCCLN